MLQASSFVQEAVLCFVLDGSQVLLIEKLRGLGKGKINGPGGKREKGESLEETAIRETIEEVRIKPGKLSMVGRLGFRFSDGYSLYAEIFLARSYEGSPGSTEEAIPFWCPIDQIPYSRMWADDIIWLPRVLSGSFVEGLFYFDGDTMTESHVSFRPWAR